eukprot:TRINITY_DN2681_c0_g1_i1.p1 TRINITY_DN2681_c0_g1~~TRINITY_DN2681_c0_g1_i1.p1  ORF type:complete len:287 (+),score=50.42 TRINITY_DN2681_c0_g1_i1:265-1125(+)
MYPLTYPLIGLFVVLFLGYGGSLLPSVVSKVRPNLNVLENPVFKFCNGFAGGIIVAVAFVHSFPEACLDLEEALPGFPYAGLIAMIGALLTFIAEDGIATWLGFTHDHSHDHTHDKQGATKTPEGEEKAGKVKFYTEMYSLLFGLTFHSVFVGFALGLNEEDLGLLIAILCHQFFEGVALGLRILRAGVSRKLHVFLIDSVFALAAPIGVAIGMAVQTSINDNPQTFSIVQGVFNALSAGILVYVGLLHMIVEEVQRVRAKRLHQFLLYLGVALGATFMSILAIWA